MKIHRNHQILNVNTGNILQVNNGNQNLIFDPTFWNTIMLVQNEDTNKLTVYLNGQLYGEKTEIIPTNDLTTFSVANPTEGIISGYFGPQVIYNKAITATEAEEIHQILMNQITPLTTTSLIVTGCNSNTNCNGIYTLSGNTNTIDTSSVWVNEKRILYI